MTPGKDKENILYFPSPVNIKYDSSFLQVNTPLCKVHILFDNNQD